MSENICINIIESCLHLAHPLILLHAAYKAFKRRRQPRRDTQLSRPQSNGGAKLEKRANERENFVLFANKRAQMSNKYFCCLRHFIDSSLSFFRIFSLNFQKDFFAI